jgi:uncharacterized protein (TIGR02117 family)
MRRRYRYPLILLALAIAAPVLGALVPRPLVPTGAGETDGEATRRVLVLSNPIHTDIAFPADREVLDRFGFLADAGLPIYDPNVRWIVAGWGGREFYLETPEWSDLKAGPLFKGLTRDRSVMHMAVAGEIDPAGESVLPLDLSQDEFDRMLEATMAGFATDAGGRLELIEGRSYGEYDRFYEANGAFTALLGCNTWTGAVLRAGGIRTGMWNPLPQSLVWSVRLFNDLP